ncbi:zinc transport system permease protein [Eubacterium uniforme]|uniref:Zinc transport system permease protein n=1 Tax=Eubacterium uniforme TaxID=39495 RepID=A0A1T4VDB0_9FIRM|nr:metal ABC transporter permease [Eubacterium uniforme]SKA62942.1 zinc transport system permease protein [Eubacterium uniforme]
MFDKLFTYLQYEYVINAFIVGILVAICSSLLGVTLVLKRFSFIGDGLSHVAFGAIAIALVLKVSNNMLLVLPITVISAVLLLKGGNNKKIQGDAAIAMISVSALALGYLLMNIFSTSSNLSGDVCSTLFGSTSMLTLDSSDVILSVALSIVVVAVFVVFYNKIFAVTFDENFSKACGINAQGYNLLIAVLIAVIIVMAMNFVGSLLISALVIFPSVSAMRVFNSFKMVTISSVVISLMCTLVGLCIAIVASTPVGATIVACDIVAFIVFCIIGRLTR